MIRMEYLSARKVYGCILPFNLSIQTGTVPNVLFVLFSSLMQLEKPVIMSNSKRAKGMRAAWQTIACLLLLRRGRHSGAPWLWAALALDIAMTVAERLDNEIYSMTGMFVSGHNVKHVLAGVLLGCTLAWLLLREPSSPSGNRAQLS